MPKTSLEIAIRLIFHDFLTHGRERVNSLLQKPKPRVNLGLVEQEQIKRN